VAGALGGGGGARGGAGPGAGAVAHPHLSITATYTVDAQGGTVFTQSGYIAAAPAPDTAGGMWLAVVTPGDPGSDVREAPTASDGALVHVGADGAVSTHPMPTPYSFPDLPAVATDGALWFGYAQGDAWANTVDTGEYLTDQVESLARLSPDGKIERFAIMPADDRLTIGRIVAGPDGTAWFDGSEAPPHARVANNVLGRIWPDGHSKLYDLPSEPTGLSDLLANRDGTLWIYPMQDPPELALLDPDTGAIREQYVVPGLTSYDHIEGPVAGQGSSVWLSAIHELMELDSDGVVALKVSTDDNSDPEKVAADRQGGLWAMSSAQNNPADHDFIASTELRELTHVSPDGSVERFTTPMPMPRPYMPFGPASVASIAVGSDGAVWLTDGPKAYRLD
jgi:hypothetical protein